MDFLKKNFSLDRVMKGAAKFDRNKLLAFNLDALQEMDPDEFHRRLRAHAENYRTEYLDRMTDAQFEMFAKASQPRSKTLDGPFQDSRFFIMDDDEIVYEETKAVRKALHNGEPNGLAHLEAVKPILASLDEWTIESIERAVKAYADEHAGGKLGKVAQPLRIAVTGGTISPAIFDTLAILGQEHVLNRITRCLRAQGEKTHHGGTEGAEKKEAERSRS